MIYFNWPPGPFLATQYDKEPGGAGFEAMGPATVCRRLSAAQMRFYTVERLSDERSFLGNRLL